MKIEILRAIVAYPESTIQEINNIVQKTFPLCTLSSVKNTMAEHNIKRVRVRGNLYKFEILGSVITAIDASDRPLVKKSKVDRVWTPKMKTCALSAVMEREKHRWKYN